MGNLTKSVNIIVNYTHWNLKFNVVTKFAFKKPCNLSVTYKWIPIFKAGNSNYILLTYTIVLW